MYVQFTSFVQGLFYLDCGTDCIFFNLDFTWYLILLDTGHKLNVHKTFRRRPGHLLNVLCTFNLRPVSTGVLLNLIFLTRSIKLSKTNNFGTCFEQYEGTTLCLKENIKNATYLGNNLMNNKRQLTSEAWRQWHRSGILVFYC